jgi:hypothetical protein
VASQVEFRKRFGDREAILLVSASTTSTSGGLCLLIPRDKSSYQEFASSHPILLSFHISYCNLVCLYIISFSIYLGLTMHCKILWDEIFMLVEL